MIWCGHHFDVFIDRFWCNFSYQKHHMISFWHKKKQSKNQKRYQNDVQIIWHQSIFFDVIHVYRNILKNILCLAPLCICVKIVITMAVKSNSMWSQIRYEPGKEKSEQSGTDQSTLLMCFVDSARSIIHVSPFPPSSLNFQNKFYIS